jgi:heme iron utilization protein
VRKKYDEPMCPPDEPCPDERKNVKDAIQELMNSELFAVLSTQNEGQPYASLISFAASADLKRIVFATTRETRKYTLLEKSPQVALLVDDRSQNPPLINHIQAVTITGRATILPDKKTWGSLLLEKHPYLLEFIENPTTALIRVEVYRYFYVRRFQEVSQWIPP